MIISVNNMRKSSGASTFSVALGVFLTEATDLSILLVDTNYMYSDLNDIFGIEPDRGIDDVIDLALSNKLTEGIFKDIVVNLGSVGVLTGSKIVQYNRYETETISFGKIFDIAESLYDIVIIDSPPRKMGNFLDQKVNENRAYLNIQVCKQNFLAFERYISSKEYNMQKSVIAINEYWDGRKLNKQSIINNYKITIPVFSFRHSDKLSESFNERKIDIYLLNENDVYIHDMKTFINYLSKQYRFPIKPNFVIREATTGMPEKKRGIFW